MRFGSTITLSVLLLTATTACGEAAGPAPVAAPPATAADSPSAPSAPSASSARPAAPAPDAKSVTEKLARTLPVRLTVTYDATSDPNGKLGRPHQYLSKTAFDDTRVSDSPKAKDGASQGRRDSISYGGTVEVFATPEDAETWVKYVDAMQATFSGFSTPDHLYRSGVTVVRVSHVLTADQAKAYENAIR
ncbi:hypothetical protein ACIRBX_02920 [Kitasatospora sp. NPDC096147]|uniref:hypothetical protein n=1 Tax=Kitasatospora sp. NPDC096147 TaxID=3364093 RepID=UPI0038005FD6